MAWFSGKQSNKQTAMPNDGSVAHDDGQSATGAAQTNPADNVNISGQVVQPGAAAIAPPPPPTPSRIANPGDAAWWQQAEQATPQSLVTVSETEAPPAPAPSSEGISPNPPPPGPAYLGPPVHPGAAPGPADREPVDPPMGGGPTTGATIQSHGGSPLQKAQSYLDHSPSLQSPLERQNSEGQSGAGSLSVSLTDPSSSTHGTWAGLRPDELNPLGGFNAGDSGKGKD